MDSYEVLRDEDSGRTDDDEDEIISHQPTSGREREAASEKKGGGGSSGQQNTDLRPLVKSAESPDAEEAKEEDGLSLSESEKRSSRNGIMAADESLNDSKRLSAENRTRTDLDLEGGYSGRGSGDEIQTFEFVPGNTSEFGLDSSDADQLIGTPTTNNTILASSEKTGSNKEDSPPELDTSNVNERDNQAYLSTEYSRFNNNSPDCDNGSSSSSSSNNKDKVEKSPLIPDHNILKDLVKKGQQGVVGSVTKRNDKVPLLPSPTKTDVSSEEESTLMSVSLDLELDSLRSPGQPSSDADGEDQGVCSKYSQLSEDGSSPSSQDDKTQTGEVIGSDHHHKNRKPSVFDNTLELSMVFSEFVDVESFSSSLGHRSPQTEDKFGGKFEDHLLILLRSASHKNLKSLLRRSGWPAESNARCHLWENLCVHLAKAGSWEFEDMAKDVSKSKSEEDVSLPLFVDPRLLPSYHLNTYGVHTARRILKVMSHLNPDVLHCPLLYPLTSAFLHYMGPTACYNSMQALLRSCSPSYLTETKTSTKAVSLVLKDLAKKYVKSAYVYVTKGVDETVFDHWMYWLFQDLPFETVVCIIDCFLLEGHKVLYRVILAILSRFTKHMKKTRSPSGPPEDMKKAISNFCSSLSLESKRLLRAGFSIRGLTRKEIHKLEARHRTQIKSQPVSDAMMANDGAEHGIVMCDLCPDLIIDTGLKALLTTDMMNTIWTWIPKRLTLKNPTLLYTSDEHGITLRTLFVKSEFAEQTLLVIKTDEDEIFGAFCSASWHERREKNKPHTSFFGTGETFVFTMKPSVKQYPWVGADGSKTGWSSDLYMAADDTILIVGSGNGEAIQLDAMMNRCRSTRCDTFNNDPLCSKEDFCCSVVQVYGFVD